MNQFPTFPDLNGASVFITGGGSGIGAALTDGFLQQGAQVAFVQRTDATGFCDDMERRHGRRPLFLPCDVTDIGALEDAVAVARDAHGAVTVLINNAAVDQRMSLDETTPDAWDHLMNVNLRPHAFTARAVRAGMAARGKGAIVNYSSISFKNGAPGMPAYATAKAAISGLTMTLARDFGRDGIRVNALLPGWVMTERQRALWVTEEALTRHVARQCLARELTPADMVAPTLFLASDASAAMTGQAMIVDGGVILTH
jgi:NAD(P)-dependent dehydrogenase (short-subunit alcohol dehydrogenase family)